METIDFTEGSQPSEPLENSIVFSNISSSILDKQASIVVMVGAGISTQVGLRDFRSPQGLYSESIPSTSISASKARELFQSSVYLDPTSRALHWRFIVDLHSQVESIQTASETHKFLKRLSRKNKLARVYSQNIDGIEGKAGLSYVTLIEEDSLMEEVDDIEAREFIGDVVQLHGVSLLSSKSSFSRLLIGFFFPPLLEYTRSEMFSVYMD